MVRLALAVAHSLAVADVARKSSEDEIANVNFLYDDIVHALQITKYNRLVHKFRHRSTRSCVETQVYQIQ